jgi:hypothetical protein
MIVLRAGSSLTRQNDVENPGQELSCGYSLFSQRAGSCPFAHLTAIRDPSLNNRVIMSHCIFSLALLQRTAVIKDARGPGRHRKRP